MNFEQRHRRRATHFARATPRSPTICFDEIVNGAGATSIFFRCTKNRGAYVDRARTSRLINKCEWRGDFFSLKPPQTYDINYAGRPFRWGRATFLFWEFSRWILMSDKKVKIILVFVMFLRIVQKVTFWASGMEDMFWHRSPLPLYYI